MDILDRTLNPLDYADTTKSLKEIESYLNRTMETIDYTLSRQSQQISGGIDPAQFLLLTQKVAELNGSISSLSGRISNVEQAITALESRVSANETELADHEARIKALETQP